MPLTNEILVSDRIVLIIASGVIDDHLAITNRNRLAEHPDFDPAFDQIVDLTGVSRIELTQEGMAQLSTNSPFLPTSRRAFIIASKDDEKKIGIFAGMIGTHSDSVLVTAKREEAYRWLLEKTR